MLCCPFGQQIWADYNKHSFEAARKPRKAAQLRSGGAEFKPFAALRNGPRSCRATFTDPDLDKVFAESAAFLDPILAGRIDGEWDPHRRTWT